MNPAPYTPQTIHEIRVRAGKGQSDASLAHYLGWEVSRLWRLASRHGIELRPAEAFEVTSLPAPVIVKCAAGPARIAQPTSHTSAPAAEPAKQKRQAQAYDYRSIGLPPRLRNLLARLALKRRVSRSALVKRALSFAAEHDGPLPDWRLNGENASSDGVTVPFTIDEGARLGADAMRRGYTAGEHIRRALHLVYGAET